MATAEVIIVDGSQLEGGGQIVRICTALSSICHIPVMITNIRGRRQNPGLKAQHLRGIELVKVLTNGSLIGNRMESMEIIFHPKNIAGGTFTCDTKTAGSVCLILQSALPICAFSCDPSILTLRGGTNADMAPFVDYMQHVFRPLAQKFGLNFKLLLKKRGFYPQGGGELEVQVDPLLSPLKAVELLDPGEVIQVKGLSFVAGVLPIRVAYTMAYSATSLLRTKLNPDVEINIDQFKEPESKAFGNGACIFLYAETSTGCVFGGSCIGRRGIPAELVGSKAAKELLQGIESGSCVDAYAQDQLVLLMSLATGTSRVRTSPVTLHTRTAIHVAKLMTKVEFRVTPEPGKNTVLMECKGLNVQV